MQILNTVYNQSGDPETGCVLTPLGSPTTSQNCMSRRSGTLVRWSRGGTRDGYGGPWYRGIPTRPVPTQPARKKPTEDPGSSPSTAERAPEGSCREPGVGGTGTAGVTVGGVGQDHPPGPVGALQAPPCPSLANAHLGPIRARFHDILLKVSQNPIVSPKSVEKACHSPYLQNEAQKSPLDFLRFLYSSAFSHKELMAAF